MESYCGTDPFMAPEIFQGQYDEKVDVYALAVILYLMLEGVLPAV